MNPTTPTTTEPKGPTSNVPQWASSLSFCPQCLQRVYFNPADAAYAWIHCSTRWEVVRSVICPHPECGRSFEFSGQKKCPFCQAGFDDGVPLSPRLPGDSLLDSILPSRGLATRTRRARAEREFRALRVSWCCDSTLNPQIPFDDEARFTRDLRAVLSKHEQLLTQFQGDVEKFLYAAPIRLAKFEGDYSWKLEEALGREIDSVLNGLLFGRHSVPHSLGFVARCYDRFPHSYSRRFLAAELRRRFYGRRSAPKSGFQLTLEYARTLDGIAFEEWLTRLLRDAGIPGVCKTQASRDQGADIVITIGTRKIIVQAKQYQDTLGNKAVQEAFTAMHFYNANEAWVVTTSTFSRDAIDLAFRTGVRLIDGSRLMNLPELLRGPIQTVTDKSAISGQPHPTETPETQQSAPTAAQVETTQASPMAPNASEDDVFREDEAVVSEASSAKPAGPQSSPGGHLLRDRRLVGIGVGVIVLLTAVAGYQEHASRQRPASEPEIRELLESYQNAEHSRDPQLLAACYAPEVETFYLRHNVSRSDVLHEFQHQFAEIQDVHRFTISRIIFSEVSKTRATATFEREWDFRGTKNFSGAEREQMIFQKIDDNWRIVSEIELEKYLIHGKVP